MKRTLQLLILVLVAVSFTTNTQAQESNWSVGGDFVSNYIWRGLKFGSGPAIQPSVEFATSGFAIGAWGSFNITDADNEAAEADLYAGYTFDLGNSSTFGIAFTDYFFPGGDSKYFEAASHYFEPAVTLGIGDFNLLGAYMISNKPGDDDDTDDFYVQAGYTVGPVDLFIGGGDGQYSLSGDFNISNIGISTSKELKITDSFSLPVFGSVILNPNSEQFYVVVGFSL